MISKVNLVLQDPIKNWLELQILVLDLCNYHMNVNCRSCINEAVMLLSNWLKQQGQQNEYFKRAVNNEYELKQINLFVQVYKSDNEDRQRELDVCLKINKELNINGVPYFNMIEIGQRLTFKEMFELTKQYDNCINIIANSDIYFNETVLQTRFINKKECYALSRWDYSNGMAILFNRKDSQDVWIFNGAVNCNGGDYFLGVAGCDNRIAYDLRQSGYSVLNPSKRIHAIHYHNTNHRTYKSEDRLLEPYHFIFPHY